MIFNWIYIIGRKDEGNNMYNHIFISLDISNLYYAKIVIKQFIGEKSYVYINRHLNHE